MSSWLGSGAGLIVIGLAVILMRFIDELPQKVVPWAMRGVIVLMFMGGSAVAITVAGKFASKCLRGLMHWGGGIGTAVAVLTAVFLLIAVFVGLLKRPSSSIANFAAILPVVLGIFAAGALHSVDKSTTNPARHGTSQIDSWLHRDGSDKKGGK